MRSSSLIAPVLALAAATPAGQVTRYSTPTASRVARLTLPDPVAWVVEEAASSLAVSTASKAPAALLLAARDALQEGTPAERAAAALVLGYGRQRDDRALLIKAANDSDHGVAARAIVGLGLLGDSAARLHLIGMLETRALPETRKAVAAFALGLIGSPDDGMGGGDYLKSHALKLLRLSRSKHAAQIAACFIGFPKGEGRAVLLEYLGRNKALIVGSDRHVEAEALLRGIALGALASRFATDEEWIVVRSGLGSHRTPSRRFMTAWGLYRHGGNGISKKLRAKVARALGKRLGDKRTAVRVMALLALGGFDARAALRKARAVLRAGRSGHDLLPAAMIAVGRLGAKADLATLEKFAPRKLESGARAAWCLAAAELARRVDPDAWPHVPAKDTPAPFPLPQLREALGAHLAPAGVPQAAAAVALARLGDKGSVFRLREFFWRTVEGDTRRTFALALLRLDPKALDARPADAADAAKADLRLAGWSYASAPQVWTPLLARLAAAKDAASRVEAFRVAGLALAGNSRDLGKWVRRRVGPVRLPEPLATIPRWHERGTGVNMRGGRRR